MTQRKFIHTPTGLTILTGWDRPLQYFFLTIERETKDDHEIVWSNLSLVEQIRTLEGIEAVLKQHGLPLPEAVEYGLSNDKSCNLGNLFRDHGAYPRTSIKAAVLEDGKWVRKDLAYTPEESGGPPRLHTVISGIVGGLIEGVPLPEPACDMVTVFVNEEGKIMNPPLAPSATVSDANGQVWHMLAGPLVVLGSADEADDFEDLTDEGFEALTRCLTLIPLASGPLTHEYDTQWHITGPN